MRERSSGFTLLELLFTVAILAILTSLALPSFTSLIANNRLATAANETLAAMMLARSEAFKRSRSVVVCKSNDSATCTTAGTWSSGWIVFVDDNANGSREAPSEMLLRVGAAASGMSITGASGAENTVRFTSRGATTITGGSPTITLGISGYERRELRITPTGRVSVVKGSVYP